VKVTVFGATGKIGALVLRRLLDDGHEVTAFVRSPGKLGIAAAAVDVVAAELTDEDVIREAVEDADAVISALGPPIDPFVRGTPLTDGTRRIVAAMPGAEAVWTYNAASGQEQAATLLQPGQGAWWISQAGGRITVAPGGQVATPTPTPSPTPQPTPQPTPRPQTQPMQPQPTPYVYPHPYYGPVIVSPMMPMPMPMPRPMPMPY